MSIVTISGSNTFLPEADDSTAEEAVKQRLRYLVIPATAPQGSQIDN
jgi:hypothetical protein